MSEPSLFDTYPVVDHPVGHVGPPPGQTIEEAFLAFHAANPHVYAELVLLTRRARRRGNGLVGMKMLFEVLRWRRMMSTYADPNFKLNNNYTSYYARLIMLQEPDLVGAFETRRLHTYTGGTDGHVD